MNMRWLFLILLMLFFAGFAFANTYLEDFNDLIFCDIAKTTGGWDVVDSFGTVTRKPPTEASWGNATGQTQKCDVSGDYVYAADNDGLAKFSISGGTQTAHISLALGNSIDIAISGGYGFVPSTNAFYSVNLSDMASSYNLNTRSYYGVAIKGDSAYVGCGSDGLARIDISDPTSMVDRGNVTWTSCDARGVAIYQSGANSYAIVADRTNGVDVVNITGALSNDHTTSLGEGGLYVAVRGTLAVLAAGDSIYVLGLGNAGSASDLTVHARMKARDFASDADFINDTIFIVADGAYGMDIFRIGGSDVGKVYMLCGADTSNSVSSSAKSAKGATYGVLNNSAFVCDNNGVQILQFSGGGVQPASAWADTLTEARGWPSGEAIVIQYANGYLFASNQTYGVVSVDVSDPSDMSVVGSLTSYSGNPLIPALGSDLPNDTLFLCCANRSGANFFAIDVSNPASMSVLNTLSISASVNDVAVSGDYAYIACSDAVRKFQISTWSLTGDTYSATYPFGSILVDGSYVYVDNEDDGVRILNTSDLTLVTTYNTAGHPWGLAKIADTLYVADKEGGLYKLDVSTTPPTLVGWGTNPVTTTTLGGEPVSAAVFGDYIAVGLLEGGATGDDVKLIDRSDGSLDYDSPIGAYIGEDIVSTGNFLFIADYTYGIKSWQMSSAQVDTLNSNTNLQSKLINGGSSFQYLHWRAVESLDSDQPDTATYYLVYYNGSKDSIKIFDNSNDPPNDASGNRTYFNLGASYDNLYWFGGIVEHNTSPSLPADTTYSVDTIEIEYRATVVLLRRTASVDIALDAIVEELSIVFDEGASLGTDSLDVLSDPSDHAHWSLNGILYRTISLPHNQIPAGLRLVLDSDGEISDLNLDNSSLIVDGEQIYTGMPISTGGHEIITAASSTVRNIYRTKSGWNLISLAGTSPATREELGFDNAYRYDPSTYSYVPADLLLPGEGYFCLADDGFAFYDGNPLSKLSIPLDAGWNLIGGISENISLGMLSTNPPDAILRYCIYSMLPGTYSYFLADEIVPKYGYWVFAFEPCTLFVEPESETFYKPKCAENPFTIPLRVRSDGYENTLYIGISENASDKFDYGMDIPLLPQLPQKPTLAYFTYNGPSGKLLKDVRSSDAQWDLQILETLQFTVLGDHRMGEISISNGENSISVSGGETVSLQPGNYKLFWNESDGASLPRQTALEKMYPNPFNSAVQISVQLAEDDGEIEILDLSGRVMKSFALSGAGFHKIVWNAKSQSGATMPSGMYFVRLKGGKDSMRYGKILLVR